MSPRWDCPDEYEARRQAQRDVERDLPFGAGFTPRGPYDCEEGNEAYRREYRYEFDRREEERRIEQRQAERRRQEREEEESYYRSMEEPSGDHSWGHAGPPLPDDEIPF